MSDLSFAPPHFGAYPPGHACPRDADLPLGVHHVDLQSGQHRDCVIPDLGMWASFGYIPNGLVAMAIKVEWEDFEPAALTAKERDELLELRTFVVSRICRPEVPVEFVRGWSLPVGTEGAEPVEPRMPSEDPKTLWAVATGAVMVGEAREQWAALRDAMLKFRSVPGRASATDNGAGAANGSSSDAGNRRSAAGIPGGGGAADA